MFMFELRGGDDVRLGKVRCPDLAVSFVHRPVVPLPAAGKSTHPAQ